MAELVYASSPNLDFLWVQIPPLVPFSMRKKISPICQKNKICICLNGSSFIQKYFYKKIHKEEIYKILEHTYDKNLLQGFDIFAESAYYSYSLKDLSMVNNFSLRKISFIWVSNPFFSEEDIFIEYSVYAMEKEKWEYKIIKGPDNYKEIGKIDFQSSYIKDLFKRIKESYKYNNEKEY